MSVSEESQAWICETAHRAHRGGTDSKAWVFPLHSCSLTHCPFRPLPLPSELCFSHDQVGAGGSLPWACWHDFSNQGVTFLKKPTHPAPWGPNKYLSCFSMSRPGSSKMGTFLFFSFWWDSRFELRTLSLQSRYFSTWVTPSVLFVLVIL
jgi:hypothetical protein